MRLTLDGITHGYGRDGLVLDRVTLEVSTGEIVGVVGPSGSGKTTLLSIAGLLLQPMKGRVQYSGRAVTPDDASQQLGSRVAWLFQTNNVFGERTALDNVALGLLPVGRSWSNARADAKSALERVGLDGRDHDRVSVLSGGEAQRVGVARVIAQQPDLLLCDEPTAQLDRGNSVAVFAALGELGSASTTVVIATHDHRVEAIADRMLELESGRLRVRG